MIDSLFVEPDSSCYGSRIYDYSQPGAKTLCTGETEEIILGAAFTVKELDTQGIVAHYYKLAKGIGYSSHWGAEITMWSRSLIYAEVNGIILGDKITSIKDDFLFQNFELHQNYPNPFNPTTTNSFTIPDVVRQHAVSLHIYDLLGRKIATPIDRKNLYGYHEVEFDASNLPSGVYFYRITIHSDRIVTPEFTSTKKMILMK